MRRLLTFAGTLIAVVPLLAGMFAPASARPLGDRDLLTIRQAATVYPGLRHGTRFKGSYSITAPRSAMVHGDLECDRYKRYPGTSRRTMYIFNLDVRRSVSLSQIAVRFRSVRRAKSVLRHYRRYLRTCRGTHDTTDGEGGHARMKVRRWPTPRIGGGSVGMLIAFIQYGDTTWRRTVVARTGRIVSVQEVEPFRGKGGPKRAIRISRKAIAKLR